MDQRAFCLTTLRHVVYLALMLLCYLFQEIPAFLSIGGVRPSLVLALVVAIAMFEGEFVGGLYGLCAGFLSDLAAFHFFGFASVLFCVLGCAAGLLVIYLMQQNIRSALLLTLGSALIYGLLLYYLMFGIWGYEDAAWLLLRRTLPMAFYTGGFGILFYYCVRFLHLRINAQES